MQLIFATNNQYKAAEIQAAVGDRLKIITLKDAAIDIDIPEPYDTLEANASEKSRVINKLTGLNCFSEDTGLEVTALNGEPGLKSARYAGDGRDADLNIKKLLHQLEDKENRGARFRTVISLILDKKEYLFEGICEGMITLERSGQGGFGYDSVFAPHGSSRTFAQMSMEEKNLYSHRKIAALQLIRFLQEYISIHKEFQ